MATVVIDDLFGGPARRVGIAPGEVVAAPPAPKRRNVTSTQREGHARILQHAGTIDGRCAAELLRQGVYGASRQELAVSTGIALSSVCGAVDRLMKARKAFEPVTGIDDDLKPTHLRRDRRKVLVHISFQHSMDWRASRPVRTSAT